MDDVDLRDFDTDDLGSMKHTLARIREQCGHRVMAMGRQDQNTVVLAIVCEMLIQRVQDLEAMVKEMR